MRTGRPGADEQRSRFLLESVLDRVQNALPVSDLLRGCVDVERVTEMLLPVARPDRVLESIVGSGDRVDAVVSAGDSQWRVVFGSSSVDAIDWLDVYERPDRFDGNPGGLAIVVNGPSGAGKSTLMRALQPLARFPLVVLDEPEHIGTVQPRYLIWRDRAPALHRGYLAAAAALAAAGNHLAIAAAGHARQEFVDAFGDVPTFVVGLTCDLDVLVRRERRTGRWAGIAAASLGVHEGWNYDLQFDTTNDPDPASIARQVLTASTTSAAPAPPSRRPGC